jgi:hypothetical protein
MVNNMYKSFILVGIICVFMLAISYIMLTTFNSVFYDPDTGLDTILDDMAQDQFNDDFAAWHSSESAEREFLWQFTGLLIVGVIFLLVVIYGFKKRETR